MNCISFPVTLQVFLMDHKLTITTLDGLAVNSLLIDCEPMIDEAAVQSTNDAILKAPARFVDVDQKGIKSEAGE